jgi:hypothetical protein
MTEFDEVKYWHGIARKYRITHKNLSIFQIINMVREAKEKARRNLELRQE